MILNSKYIKINKFKNFILILLTLIFVLYYIWFRFLRERLPRDIPFHLTILSLLSLCFICYIYSYKIYRMYKPKIEQSIWYYYISVYSFKTFKALELLDDFLKKISFFKKFSLSLAKFFVSVIKHYKLYSSEKPMTKIIYIFFNYIPRIILLVSFLIDVFYFSQLYFFYVFIPFGFLPIIQNYILYSLKKLKQEYAQYLDDNFYIIYDKKTHENKHIMCYHLKGDDDGLMNPTYCIERQADNLIFDYKDLYEFNCIETWFAREHYAKEHNIKLVPLHILSPKSDEISIELSKKFEIYMPLAVYLHAFLEGYSFVEGYKKISILFLLGWVYILFVSFHTLNLYDVLNVLETIQTNSDPFSDLSL